jgi:hypothetical protein
MTFTSRGITLDENNRKETFNFIDRHKSSANILNSKKRKFEPKMLVQLPVENFIENINILKLVFSLFGSTFLRESWNRISGLVDKNLYWNKYRIECSIQICFQSVSSYWEKVFSKFVTFFSYYQSKYKTI